MLNFISLGDDLYFEGAIGTITSTINSSFDFKYDLRDPHMKTRHIVSINDHSLLQCLMIFSKIQGIEEGDEVIFLSNVCTEQLTQKFIKKGCYYKIVKKKITIKRLMQLFLHEMVYCYMLQDKTENLIITPTEMKILEGIHSQLSVRQISKDISITEKKISRHKINIIKKMGLSSYHELLSLICHKNTPHDFSFYL